MKITAVSENVRSIELDSIEVRNAVNFWLWLELGWRFGSDWKYEVPEMDGLTATAVAGGVSPQRRRDAEIGQTSERDKIATWLFGFKAVPEKK